jgi:hypothetical protein
LTPPPPPQTHNKKRINKKKKVNNTSGLAFNILKMRHYLSLSRVKTMKGEFCTFASI